MVGGSTRCVALLSQVFSIFEQCKASVDVVASSDVSVSMTLDPKTTSSVDMDLLMVIHSIGGAIICDLIPLLHLMVSL